MEKISRQQVLDIVSSSMMASHTYWKQAVVYKPLSALIHITTAHYLSIDEPNIILSKESQQIVDAFSAGSDEFIVFKTYTDAERKAIVNDFVQLPEYAYLQDKWNQIADALLAQWQPWAIDDFFIDVEEAWKSYRIERFRQEIEQVLAAHSIDLDTICIYPLVSIEQDS